MIPELRRLEVLHKGTSAPMIAFKMNNAPVFHYPGANLIVHTSDAFSKREQADENYYVRQKEMEKLQALKAKIDEHKKHLEELDKHVYVLPIVSVKVHDQ